MGAVVWMGSVLAALVGTGPLVALLGALVVCAAAAWVYGRWGGVDRPRAVRIASGAAAVLLAATAVLFAVRSAYAAAPVRETRTASAASAGIDWQPYSPERVEELRAAGRAVFIEFSAEWCLTCQVNERFALRSAAVVRRFRELDIAALKADWTDRDERITRALAAYGRAGVPLYVLYGRGAEQPVLLPELLTPGLLLEALERLEEAGD